VSEAESAACYKSAMARTIRRLRDIRATDGTEVGGKAARLGELLATGVRVPDGIVLSADRGPAGHGEASDELRAAVRSLGAGLFAVRSSAIGEDGAERSFAGMYESVLDVAADDVPDAVERVLASTDGRVAEYDRGGEARMAVIVQRMNPLFSALNGMVARPLASVRVVALNWPFRSVPHASFPKRTATPASGWFCAS